MSNNNNYIPELYGLDEAISWYADCMGISVYEARQEAETLIVKMEIDEGYSHDFAVNTFIEDTKSMTIDDYDTIERRAKESGATKHQAKAVDAYGKKRTRERKPDKTKRKIIEVLAATLDNFSDATVAIVTNPEREIVFSCNGDEYKVTLSKSRKKKD